MEPDRHAGKALQLHAAEAVCNIGVRSHGVVSTTHLKSSCNKPVNQLHVHRFTGLLQDSEATGDQTFAEFKKQRRAEQDDIEFPDEVNHLLCSLTSVTASKHCVQLALSTYHSSCFWLVFLIMI